ncbi:hypothetical protein EBR96_08870 [bacterium]|nr:hypothetical protein [bacterium]
MVLFCANVDVRYLIFSYPPLIALGAAVIVSSPIYSAKWFRGLMIVMVFVTVLFTYFGTRIDRMRGADIVMDAALTTSQTRRLLVIGNNPHSLIFEARRSDPGLRSVVLRDSKLLYAANWFLDRDPEVFVHSGSEILDRLRLAGIDTVIVDLAGVPPIIAPAVSDALRMPGMVRVSDHIIQLGDQVSTVSIYYVEGVGTPSATISLPIKTSDRFSEIKADLSFHLL